MKYQSTVLVLLLILSMVVFSFGKGHSGNLQFEAAKTQATFSADKPVENPATLSEHYF